MTGVSARAGSKWRCSRQGWLTEAIAQLNRGGRSAIQGRERDWLESHRRGVSRRGGLRWTGWGRTIRTRDTGIAAGAIADDVAEQMMNVLGEEGEALRVGETQAHRIAGQVEFGPRLDAGGAGPRAAHDGDHHERSSPRHTPSGRLPRAPRPWRLVGSARLGAAAKDEPTAAGISTRPAGYYRDGRIQDNKTSGFRPLLP
jgi:hypothetical protein